MRAKTANRTLMSDEQHDKPEYLFFEIQLIVVENLSKDEAKRLANLLKKKKLKQRDVEVIGRLLYKLCKEIAEAKNLENDAKRFKIEIYI
jgi:hypothetical protein